DIYAAAVVLWEMLAGRRLYAVDDPIHVVGLIAQCNVAPPSTIVENISPALDEVVMRGLAGEPADRFETAHDMAAALRAAIAEASPSEVGAWVAEIAGEALSLRAEQVTAIESGSSPSVSRGRAKPNVAPVVGRAPDESTASMEFEASESALEAIRFLAEH